MSVNKLLPNIVLDANSFPEITQGFKVLIRTSMSLTDISETRGYNAAMIMNAIQFEAIY
jgi:hypothetical protein